MKKVYLVELEPISTRYTGEWKVYLPKQLRQYGLEVETIEGPTDIPTETTPGMFLNFSATNTYKSVQAEKISRMFSDGKIKDGDYFLYTDAWNPTVIQLRYMAELLGIKIRIGGLWHSGSYDKHDGLGREIGDAKWVRNAEQSMYHCYDDNFFATEFHANLMLQTVFGSDTTYDNTDSAVKVGWPMEYLEDIFLKYQGIEKENLILFPHRISVEKQVDIFEDLEKNIPELEFMVCQKKNISKHQYHSLLARSKIVFSASLQETLGIGWYEGMLLNALPCVPNRLSYKEMAVEKFRYPSKWTESWEDYCSHKSRLIDHIYSMVNNYEELLDSLEIQRNKLKENFFNGDKLYEAVLSPGHPCS